MNIARRLFELQEMDLEAESSLQSLAKMKAQLGDRSILNNAESELNADKEHLGELNRNQQDLEWEINDTSDKIKRTEDEMYSGRTTNPKELSSLQQEAGILKSKRNELEDKAIQVMEEAEDCSARIEEITSRLKMIENDWQVEQEKLSENIGELEKSLAALAEKRAGLSAGIEEEAMDLYVDLRKKRGTAVAKVERGICRGCRLSLSSAQLQQVKSGDLIECSSCGRILFLA
jgi:predicted  nucleic acid-binding Zn-ribbon protein